MADPAGDVAVLAAFEYGLQGLAVTVAALEVDAVDLMTMRVV
jgi:hypothetical protein